MGPFAYLTRGGVILAVIQQTGRPTVASVQIRAGGVIPSWKRKGTGNISLFMRMKGEHIF